MVTLAVSYDELHCSSLDPSDTHIPRYRDCTSLDSIVFNQRIILWPRAVSYSDSSCLTQEWNLLSVKIAALTISFGDSSDVETSCPQLDPVSNFIDVVPPLLHYMNNRPYWLVFLLEIWSSLYSIGLNFSRSSCISLVLMHKHLPWIANYCWPAVGTWSQFSSYGKEWYYVTYISSFVTKMKCHKMSDFFSDSFGYPVSYMFIVKQLVPANKIHCSTLLLAKLYLWSACLLVIH